MIAQAGIWQPAPFKSLALAPAHKALTALCHLGCIRWRKFVASPAMRLARLLRAHRFASLPIHIHRDGLKMVGIDTGSRSAEVVDGETTGYWPDEIFIGKAMGTTAPAVGPKGAIASLIGARRPNPARAEIGAVFGDRAVKIDLGNEPLKDGLPVVDFGIASLLAQQMHRTQAVATMGPSAIRDGACTLRVHREPNLSVAIAPTQPRQGRFHYTEVPTCWPRSG